MRLNQKSDYALRILMCLCANSPRLVTVSQIANHFDISKSHLVVVSHILVKANLVDTERGRNGGMRLARPAHNIGIGEVVKITENDFAIVECLQDGKSNCPITSYCQLKEVLQTATQTFLDVLNEYTLENIVNNKSESEQCLQLIAKLKIK